MSSVRVSVCVCGWRRLAKSLERMTSRLEAMGSISALADRSLLVGSVSVYCDRLGQKVWFLQSVSVGQYAYIVRHQSLVADDYFVENIIHSVIDICLDDVTKNLVIE